MVRVDRDHFNRIAVEYERAASTWSSLYDQVAERIDPLILDRDVLDIGNGGHFAYDVRRPRRIVAVDVSPDMLDLIHHDRVEKLVADAHDLSNIADASFDAVVFSLSLHHMLGQSRRSSEHALRQILSSAQRTLRPGGRLVIAEPVLPRILYWLEVVAMPLFTVLFRWRGVSPLFFFSLARLHGLLAESLDLPRGQILLERLRIQGTVDPLGGTFPGVISIPAWLHPLRFHLCIIEFDGPTR